MRLTKTELRSQQTRLGQFNHYLPTLQLKKAMLQVEVTAAELEIGHLSAALSAEREAVESFSPFLLEKVAVNLMANADVLHVKKKYENIAGVEIPLFEKVVFRDPEYFLFDTPVWTDRAIVMLRELVIFREKLAIALEKKRALQKELRDVSIRVNLFEKILIPRAEGHISKIRIFLGDQQLAAVAQAKVAKKKIFERKVGNDRQNA
jgi:V/A-type H+-transporting ATPase subunit D